jgi:hypothetical protein
MADAHVSPFQAYDFSVIVKCLVGASSQFDGNFIWRTGPAGFLRAAIIAGLHLVGGRREPTATR